MLNTIRLKLSVPIIILWLALFGLFNFYWLPNYQDEQKQHFLKQQDTQVHVLLDNISLDLEDGDFAAVYAAIDNAVAITPSWHSIEITNQEGQLIYPLEKNNISLNNKIQISHQHHSNSSHSERISYHATLDADPTQFIKSQQNLIDELHWLFIITFIFAVTSSLILEDKVVRRPIKNLLNATRSLRQQNYNEKLPSGSNDEIGELIREFSLMRDSINTYNQELTKARDKALETTKTKTEFLANMTHELRTPLNGIMGFTQLMEESLRNNQEIDLEDIQFVYQSSKDLLNLIDNVLILSKTNERQRTLQLNCVILSEVIDSIVRQYKSKIERNDNTLTISLTSDKIELTTDIEKITKIISELLQNANRFTLHGDIHISDKFEKVDDREYLTISISDNGLGIEEKNLSEIFAPFCQVDNSMTRKFNGAGIGLSICQKLAEELSGSIIVKSTLGKGSTFSLRIPRHITA